MAGLPFRNLGGDPSQDYFADAITEDLTSDMSRLAGSFVISRNTAFTYKGQAVDIRRIGRELGVRYVLDGSVRRMGGTVRVNAQLIDAGTGANLWADQIDVDQGTLATVQDNLGISSRLARTLSVELVNVEGRRAHRANPDAVDLTMRGWSILNGGPNREDVEKAIGLFEDALRIDPGNGQARVGLAQALVLATPRPSTRASSRSRPGRRSGSPTSISRPPTPGEDRPPRRPPRSWSS
jgi:TolB-like protein